MRAVAKSIYLSLLGTLAILGITLGPVDADTGSVSVWQRWEATLTSAKTYDNPYADVILRVTYTGPNGESYRTYGFWDGGTTFKIRCAFSAPGTWKWATSCSDASDAGLQNQTGTVEVTAYTGDNPLYKHGFLKISEDKRHLSFHDTTPFLWMGDTVWHASCESTMKDWKTYIADRKAKHFSVIQIATNKDDIANPNGDAPFTDADKGIDHLNPAYWRYVDDIIEYANENGMVVLMVSVMDPLHLNYTALKSDKSDLFIRNFVARTYGNFIIYSPIFDLPYDPNHLISKKDAATDAYNAGLVDKAGAAIKDATSVHLVTAHVGTPSNGPADPIYSDALFDKEYMDFVSVQTGHNDGKMNICMRNAVNWILELYNKTPRKPVLNIESYYDANGTSSKLKPAYQGTAYSVRSTGYLSWLSGSLGFTYGAFSLWRWEKDYTQPYSWEKAMNYPSSTQMEYMHDFLAVLPWYDLVPRHDLIKNNSTDDTKKMVFAKTDSGEVGVAYLPDNGTIQLDLSAFPAALRAQWFNPRDNSYTAIDGIIPNTGTYTFNVPHEGPLTDWVLLLQLGPKVN